MQVQKVLAAETIQSFWIETFKNKLRLLCLAVPDSTIYCFFDRSRGTGRYLQLIVPLLQNATPDSPPGSSGPFAPPQPQDTLSPLITTALPADNNPVRRLDLAATSVLSSRPHRLRICTKTALPGLPNALTLPARVPRHEAWRQQEAHRPKEDRRRRASAKRGPQNGVEARGRADKDKSCHRTYRDSGEYLPQTKRSKLGEMFTTESWTKNVEIGISQRRRR